MNDAAPTGADDGAGAVRAVRPARPARVAGVAGVDQLGLVFGALSDPTRREMLQTLLRDGSGSVPALTARLPITRRAVAKHLATLDHAGLIERVPGPGREVHYRPRSDALHTATEWLREADRAWEQRLARLRDTLEQRSGERS